MLDDFAVLDRLQGTAIDSDEQVKVYDLLHLFHRASETVHYPCREPSSVLSHNIYELISCGAGVQIHGQVVFLGETEVRFEGLKLARLVSELKTIVVEAALADCHNFALRRVCDKLINLFKVRVKHLLSLLSLKDLCGVGAFLRQALFVGLQSTTRVDANCRVEVLATIAQVKTDASVFQVACCKEELADAKLVGSGNTLVKICGVTLLAIVFALVALVRHIGCDIEKRVLLPVG